MKSEKKKILFVINTLSQAGAEMSFLELLRQIDAQRYDVSLFVLMAQGELIHCLPEHVRLLNRQYEASSVLSKAGRSYMLRMILGAAWKNGNLFRQLPYLLTTCFGMIRRKRIQPDKLLWQLLAKGVPGVDGHFDLAVAYLEGGSAYFVADRVDAAKKAAFVHIDYARAGYTRAIDRACYTRFDHIFTVSEEGKKSFLEAYPECRDKISLFHNPVDRRSILEKSRQEPKLEQWNRFEGIRLLTVGRLKPQKAYEVAVETMRLIKQQQEKLPKPVRWYVLGEGDERHRLEQQIRQSGLEGDFILLGAVDNPYPYYAGCDLYVHATRFEGRSVAIQEAQGLGLPVLASDCSGNREQITDGVDGVLCTLEPELLKDQIVALLTDQEKRQRLGAAAADKPTIYPKDIEELLALAE